MPLNINGRMKVKTLRADFKKEFGLTLRVYDGKTFADENATLASIRKGDSKGGEFSPQRNTKIGNLEDKIMDMFGIKTQVAGSDDSYLCDNDKTLAGALEADEKLMVKRDNRVVKTENTEDNAKVAIEKNSITTEEKISSELTEEEKEWLDNLWNLDEAPEAIRASKAFMLEAVKKKGSSLEYAADTLKSDKEVVLLAVQENGSALQYASDTLKSDKEVVSSAMADYTAAIGYASESIRSDASFAISFIKSLNIKNAESRFIDVGGLEYFMPEVFENETVIDEMVSKTPHQFIARLVYEKRDDTTLIEVLKKHNDKISAAVKNQFDKDFKKAKELTDNDEAVCTKTIEIREILHYYFYINLSIYSPEFKLVRNPDFSGEEFLLWKNLRERVRYEIIYPLEKKANSFDDYKAMIELVYVNDKYYDLFTDKDLISKYYDELVNHLDGAGSPENLSSVLLDGEFWVLITERPDIHEQICKVLGEKLLDMDIETAASEMISIDSKLYFLPNEVKSQLLERIESLSDEKKEELSVDVFIEYLEDSGY